MSGGEYIQLKWNSHRTAFLSNLSSLRDKQVLTDVMVSCEEQFYPAHRLVLSSCSSYFSRALELTTCQQPVLLLHGIKQATLEHLLMYMYDGQVTISRALLPELLRAGRWLGVKGLEDTGDLPPNLADNTSESPAPHNVSHMAHLVTQIFSSMASSIGVGGSRSVDDLVKVLVRACEKGAKADKLCGTQQIDQVSDLIQPSDQHDSSRASLSTESGSQSLGNSGDVGHQADQSHYLAEQISSSSCVEPDDSSTFQPKVLHVTSISATDEMGELQTHEAESYTSELQMDELGDQQDIKMVPNGFELEGREDNINMEQLVLGEPTETSELETQPPCEGGPATNSTDMQILPRIELQPPDDINITDNIRDDNEVDVSGRVSPHASEASESYSFEGWEEGSTDRVAVTANLKALQSLITEALHYRDQHRSTTHNESNIAISPVKIDRTSLKCKKCQQKFKLHIELKQHMRRVHRDLVCDICNKSFRNQSSYERHANIHSVVDGSNNSRTATTKITSITVEDLAVRAPRKAALHHTVIHQSALEMGAVLGPLRLSVKKEPGVSDNKVKIQQHKPTKHNRTYTCAVCSKTFSGLSKETYLAHVSKHRKKTVSALKSQTTKHVRSKKTLSAIKSKTTSKYFKCPYCPYKGENKRMVNGHVRVHYPDLPFRCHKCYFRSSTRPTLTTHIKRQHSEIVSQKQNKSPK